MKISQLSNTKVLISLCHEDMKSFNLSFDDMGLADAHSKKILSRLLSLACSSGSFDTQGKALMCEALENSEGCMLLISLSDKKKERKKYRIKRITEYPCYKFNCVENLLCAIENLCRTDILFYNNSAYLYNNSYYLVFDYPVITQKARMILDEFAQKAKGTKPFVARLHEYGNPISQGNAIVHIGSSL